MGADTPIPPIRIVPPPPKGRPRGGSNDKKIKPPCPAVPRRGPEAGNPPYDLAISTILMIRF